MCACVRVCGCVPCVCACVCVCVCVCSVLARCSRRTQRIPSQPRTDILKALQTGACVHICNMRGISCACACVCPFDSYGVMCTCTPFRERLVFAVAVTRRHAGASARTTFSTQALDTHTHTRACARIHKRNHPTERTHSGRKAARSSQSRIRRPSLRLETSTTTCLSHTTRTRATIPPVVPVTSAIIRLAFLGCVGARACAFLSRLAFLGCVCARVCVSLSVHGDDL